MKFVRQTIYAAQSEKFKARLDARRAILTFPQRAAEYKLNKYLMENYKLNLVQMCLKILANSKFSYTQDKELVITIIDKDLDIIAQLITYGNRELMGSKILRVALGRKEK